MGVSAKSDVQPQGRPLTWWGLALGMVLVVVVQQAIGYAYHRWWRVDTKGRGGKQVSYW